MAGDYGYKPAIEKFGMAQKLLIIQTEKQVRTSQKNSDERESKVDATSVVVGYLYKDKSERLYMTQHEKSR